MREIDADYATTIAHAYCEWVESSGFNWDYCDVVADRLADIFKLDTIDCKAAAILSMANMAVGHNRWYAMGKLMDICASSLDDAIARRIAIEIQVQSAEDRFRAAASIIKRSLDDFHPIIRRVL